MLPAAATLPGIVGALLPRALVIVFPRLRGDGGDGEDGSQCGDSPASDKAELHVPCLLVCRRVAAAIDDTELSDSRCPMAELVM
jgi:hypothetical protein